MKKLKDELNDNTPKKSKHFIRNEKKLIKKRSKKRQKIINSKIRIKRFICIFSFVIVLFIFLLIIKKIIFYIKYILTKNITKKKLKIGVVGVYHCMNAGNNLLKYSISVVLKEMGFIPYIIGTNNNKTNLDFLSKTTNLIVVNNFSEIKRDDYDILMVNSDQTWRNFDGNLLDYGFLRFAENWNLPKFIYGASLGYDYWSFTSEETIVAKRLLTQFKGISIREQGSLNLIKQNLGITPEVVLDPTLLINKNYYLDLVHKYSKKKFDNEKYILIYKLGWNINMKKLIKKAFNELKYKIYLFTLHNRTNIENFIYYINNSQAIITDSFHGTIFSIIFNKPFVSFYYKGQAEERLKSLKNLFQIKNRIISSEEIADVNLLKTPLNINYSIIEELRLKSLDFIKKNLDII